MLSTGAAVAVVFPSELLLWAAALALPALLLALVLMARAERRSGDGGEQPGDGEE
jgi:hypothetical protein